MRVRPFLVAGAHPRLPAAMALALVMALGVGCGVDNAATDSTDGGTDEIDPRCAEAKDGTSCGEGKHCVSGECRRARCGDGVPSDEEECDDGNTKSGDGCSTNCTAEYDCGNGELEPGEACDDGNTDDGDGCSAHCDIESVCGNDELEGDEECDDGNRKNGDGCSARCELETGCGNGELEGEEECDDGNADSGDGCTETCRNERCGDGRIDGAEECDDGNSESGDGCSPTCRCESDCGNGTLECGEQCDDDNQVNGDGCSRKCQIEYCGDDTINNHDEACDDGEANGKGSCSEDCELTCSSCLPECGACRADACPDLVTECYEAEGSAVAGPKAGAKKAVLCAELIECVYRTGCAAQRWEDCYCGKTAGEQPSAECFIQPKGKCAAEFSAGAESEIVIEVIERALDNRYATGNAMRLFTCDEPNCLPECMATVGCGNGELERGEECDDGNRTSFDRCSGLCKLECGDTVLTGDEECDDGNRFDGDGCSSTCELEGACGNGQREGSEECDDGNATSGDGCSATCRTEFCGDNLKNNAKDGVDTEECDGTDTPAGRTCGPDCKLLPGNCGNGTVEEGEDCEPPNTETCDANCKNNVCGNGTLDTDRGEECDDGNKLPGDGCNATCKNEFCGDNVKNNKKDGVDTEECDGTDTPSGKLCTADCKLEDADECELCVHTKCELFVSECVAPECHAILDCVHESDCFNGVDKEACYCGTNPIPVCIASDGKNPNGTPMGACNESIEAGAGLDGTEGPGQTGEKVSQRYIDPAYPLGNAFRWLNCEANECTAECGYTAPGVLECRAEEGR